MSRDGHQVAILMVDLTVAQRADIQRFHDGKEKVLIATDVCARGETPAPFRRGVKRAPRWRGEAIPTRGSIFPPGLWFFFRDRRAAGDGGGELQPPR